MEILILNFGTPKFTFDAFGPLLGSKLEEIFYNDQRVTVVGTVDNPICKQEDIEYSILLEQYAINHGALVICTDAALGPAGTNGQLFWRNGQLKPGHVTGKTTQYMGHWVMQYSIGNGSALIPTNEELATAVDEAVSTLQKFIREHLLLTYSML